MRILKTITISVILLLTISNLLNQPTSLLTEGIGKGYTFETYDGKYKFTHVPSKGSQIKSIEMRFTRLINDKPEYKQTTLFRTFKRQPFKFWKWYEYLFDEKYSYPYKNPSNKSVHYQGLSKK